jgi:hypothetical protein
MLITQGVVIVPEDLEQAGRLIAKWLAPYVAAELSTTDPQAYVPLSADYDELTADIYVRVLGDPVLERAQRFFGWIATVTEGEHGEDGPKSLTSLQLTKLLGLSSPREIAGVLTNSLKKRAKRLGLPNPWIQEDTPDGRTLWRCRNPEQAERLFRATQAEAKRRGLAVFGDD